MNDNNLLSSSELSTKLYHVRKPPGGDTNDIFNLEERQRIQRKNKISVFYDEIDGKRKNDGKAFRKHYETEDALTPTENMQRPLRRSLSECRIKFGDLNRTPPLASGKENIYADANTNLVLSKKDLKDNTTIEFGNINDEEEEEEDEVTKLKTHNRNPITGEGMDVKENHVKMNSLDNVAEQISRKYESRRPCIRVREPPGGKSSIIF